MSKEGIVELAQVADEEEGNVFVELISGSAVSVAYKHAEPVSELKKRLAELPHLSEKFDSATLNLLLDGRTLADHELIEKSLSFFWVFEADSIFRFVSAQLSGKTKFAAAVPASNSKIIFAPMNTAGVSTFDPADDSFYLVDISAQMRGCFKFAGAAPAANGKIIFPPRDAASVGIFDLADRKSQGNLRKR